MLDATQAAAGKLTVTRAPANLTELAEVTATGAQTTTDRHDIVVKAPGAIEAQVDATRIGQVLTNLLDNAIRYSPDGGEIEAKLTRWAQGTITLAVRDFGLGIPIERRKDIFERYAQAHAGQQRGGLGLGLYICKQIVERHGGTIGVECPDSGGSRFVITLPADAT